MDFTVTIINHRLKSIKRDESAMGGKKRVLEGAVFGFATDRFSKRSGNEKSGASNAEKGYQDGRMVYGVN
jgi:hypothetical protein